MVACKIPHSLDLTRRKPISRGPNHTVSEQQARQGFLMSVMLSSLSDDSGLGYADRFGKLKNEVHFTSQKASSENKTYFGPGK